MSNQFDSLSASPNQIFESGIKGRNGEMKILKAPNQDDVMAEESKS